MQPAQAFAPNATTFLTHLVGGGLADTRYVVERFRSMLDGDIRPVEAKAPKGSRRRKTRRVLASLHLLQSIRLGRETSTPLGTRADIALTRNAIKLPVEIKGQWHRAVWDAAIDQLDAKYTVDWQADGRGVYIVLWFGNVPRKNLPPHPDGLSRPKTPEELEQMLKDRLPDARRSSIDVFVIDVSRPAGTA